MTRPLTLRNLTAHYGATKVLDDLSLDVGAGELVTLLGASGCGKTTTLRLVAGFLQPTAGTIHLGETDLTRVLAHKRNIGLVFQNYALFPHLTVRDNVAFGLKQRGLGAAERGRKANEMLERVDLAALARRLPSALSGGQRQRVALARALVIEPALLMFDEPLSNLDARLRVEMRVEIRELQRANRTTAIFVTHDQEEAFSISDRVAIMESGRIRQFDRPETLYSRPANAFVARFVGFENLIPLNVTARDAGRITAEGDGGIDLTLSESEFGPIPDQFILATRPDGLRVSQGDHGIPARLGLRTYVGRAYHYQTETPAGHLVTSGSLGQPRAAGETVRLVPEPEQCSILTHEAAS